MKYQNRLLAFFDILGFKKHLNDETLYNLYLKYSCFIEKANRDIFGDVNWQPPKEVLDAEEQFVNVYYDSLSARLLRGARRRLETVIKFYEDSLGDEEMDDAKADKILAAIGKLDKTSSSLYELERSVKMEEMESSKVRGGGKINPYEISRR